MRKILPYLPYLTGYVAILLINTAQLVGLYSDLVGAEGVGVSPWLSLFALDLAILLLSFRKPDWGKASPPAIFALAIGILDLLFFVGRMDSFTLQSLLPAVLFSACFAYGIYYMAEELASIHEEQASKRQAIASEIEKARKQAEESLSERQEALKIAEEALREAEDTFDREVKEWNGKIKKVEGVIEKQSKILEDWERKLSLPMKYGNSTVKVVHNNDGFKVVKV